MMKMQDKRKLNIPLLILGLLALAAGLYVAALYDLQIDKALYNPTFSPAILVESCCYYVLYMPTAVLCALAATDKKQKLWLRIVGGGLAVIAVIALCIYTTYSINKRGAEYALYISVGIWVAILAVLFAVFRTQYSESFKKKAYFVCAWGTVLCALELSVINIVKMFWNRTRFDDMLAAGSFEKFTPWFHPLGNGGTSFPSGHTASACGILVLLIIVDVAPKLQKYRPAIFAFCLIYIGFTAFMRMMIGRHFLSDTLSAATIMLVLFSIMTRTKPYRKALHNALEAPE